MKKKTTWIKIGAVAVAAIPPVVVLCVNFPVFIQRADKAISAAALLVALICGMIFKDATKRIFQTPSAFKTCLFVFLLSYVSVTLGEQMLQISATALASGACAIPLNMWYNNETKPITTDELVETLKGFRKENNDEKNQHNEGD